MDTIFLFIEQNLFYAPFVIFFLLCLASLNIPISEDGLIFLAAVIAAKNPEHIAPLFISLFLGAYLSDVMVFGLGYKYGERLFQLRPFKNLASPERIDRIKTFYLRYGIATLLIGRFIPFGVRNLLFTTAGIARMRPTTFAIFDFIACLVTCSTYFTLYYHYGEAMLKITKRFGLVMFVLFFCSILIYWLSRRRLKVS